MRPPEMSGCARVAPTAQSELGSEDRGTLEMPVVPTDSSISGASPVTAALAEVHPSELSPMIAM
jgi:hypothetical protein